MGRTHIAMIAASLAIWMTTAGQKKNSSAVYPNELPQYQFHSSAVWRQLMPSHSTMADVRKVIGDPDKAFDVAGYTDPYPGDEAARKPVFLYSRLMPGWQIFVYFSKYCFRDHPSDLSGKRVCSIDLVPKERTDFSAIKLPGAFAKEHVVAADGAWDAYTDDTGLQYDIYSIKTLYGDHLSGDLFRISYGLPASEMTKP